MSTIVVKANLKYLIEVFNFSYCSFLFTAGIFKIRNFDD